MSEVFEQIDGKRLLLYIERIERLEEEKKGLQNDIKEVLEEAKTANFDIAAIKELLRLRRIDEQDRQEKEFIIDCYRSAIGLD